MDLFINVLFSVVLILGGYFIGAINNAVIISKLIYKKDVREYGSKNAGGTNTGRVFGRRAGVSVMALDITKAVLVYWLITLLYTFTPLKTIINYDLVVHLAIFMAAVGHCYPVYYKFKGGKAVSMIAGYLLATNWLMLLIGIIFFFIFLKLWKMVSLTSVLTSTLLVASAFLLLIPQLHQISFYPLVSGNLIYYIPTLVGIALLLIFKHRSNIARIKAGTEAKVSWLK